MSDTGEDQLVSDAAQLPPDQQADVDRLASVLAGSELPAPGELQSVPAGIANYDDDAGMCVDMFVEMATAYCADVGPLWPNDKRKKVSVAMAAVFKKYDFSFAKFGPELALIGVAGPVLWQTSKAIAKQMKDQQAAGANS